MLCFCCSLVAWTAEGTSVHKIITRLVRAGEIISHGWSLFLVIFKQHKTKVVSVWLQLTYLETQTETVYVSLSINGFSSAQHSDNPVSDPTRWLPLAGCSNNSQYDHLHRVKLLKNLRPVWFAILDLVSCPIGMYLGKPPICVQCQLLLGLIRWPSVQLF